MIDNRLKNITLLSIDQTKKRLEIETMHQQKDIDTENYSVVMRIHLVLMIQIFMVRTEAI